MNVEFVDTNVLIYAYDPAAGVKQLQAAELLEGLWARRNGVISTQVLQEFYVNVTLKIPKPLSVERASEIIADLGNWKLIRPDLPSLLSAINLGRTYRISFWDALILASAREAGAAVVWSEDLNPGQNYDGVEVRNPFS